MDIKLRFSGSDIRELPLGPGVHDIGCPPESNQPLGFVQDAASSVIRFCVDRRGVWMTLPNATEGVHVNGRPVRRMAMLRLGDTVYVNGAEMTLVSAQPVPAMPAQLADAPVDDIADPRIVLRGICGRHHGRSFTLEKPRLIGRSPDADVRIDDAAFADRHARIDLQGDTVVLRDLGSRDGSVVNGEVVRDAVLKAGDQIVFDGDHRFVIEAPARISSRQDPPQGVGDAASLESEEDRCVANSARRLPWLLLAALLIAAALSALLLFGVAG